MMSKIYYFICCLLNWSPILHFSCDENFDTIKIKGSLRISLFSMYFSGAYHYIFTYSSRNKKFSCHESLAFKSVQKRLTPLEIKAKTTEYILDISKNNEISKVQQAEFLKMRYDENREILSSSDNKIIFHSSLGIALAGILAYLLPLAINYKSNILQVLIIWSFLFLSVTYLINYFSFILEGIRVRGYYRFSFKDVKSISKESTVANQQLFFDWYASKNDVEYKSGIILNLEKFIWRSCISIFVLWILIQIHPTQQDFLRSDYTAVTQQIACFNSLMSRSEEHNHETIYSQL